MSSGDAHARLEISKCLAEEEDRWLRPTDPIAVLDPTTRTYLSYCALAHINLGTRDAKYEEIDRSGLPIHYSLPGLRVKALSTGVSAKGFWSASASLELVLPKSLSTLARIDSYEDIIDALRSISVILYDTSAKLGWLVPAQRVLLHLAQLWIKEHSSTARLKFADPRWTKLIRWWRRPIDQAPEDILRANAKLLLRINLDDDKEYYLRDLIKLFSAQLEGCTVPRRMWKGDTSDKVIKPPASDRIIGWELFDLVNRPMELRARQEVTSFSGCGWDKLADDPDIWVLMGRELGGIITPQNPSAVCRTWRPMPSNKQYLVAGMGCLVEREHLSASVPVADPQASQLVTEELQTQTINGLWWNPSANFLNSLQGCVHPVGHCPRRPERFESKRSGPLPSVLPPEGAVVSGTKETGKAKEQELIQYNNGRKTLKGRLKDLYKKVAGAYKDEQL